MDYYTIDEIEETTARRSQIQAARRGLVGGALLFALLSLLSIAVLLIGYAQIASDLPLPSELAQRAGAFQSTRIYDRNGALLNETFDPNAGRRIVVPLEEIAPWLLQATIATEDANFYEHSGVDPVSLARALYYALREGEFVSGGSTIPQQLVKLVFLSADRTAQRKIKEAILAAEISRRFAKDEILALYLNEVNYGNLAYGVDAAAETYFAVDVGDLSLAQAALLAGLPQAPAYYDPYSYPERAKERQAVVLRLMVEKGDIRPDQADAAWREPLVYTPLQFDFEAPHFVLYVRQQLEQLLGPEALYRVGLEVTTSLDLALQERGQQIVRDHVLSLAGNKASNGALVALRPQTGEILALIGSADYDNVEIGGQINMALVPRQPGSAMKPLVYLKALDRQGPAWTPATLIADIEEEFPDGANPPYRPTNYDMEEHGLVTVRSALANSYNIPAVRTLAAVGVSSFVEDARAFGITTLDRADYGLSLALGSGEVPLLEMVGAFNVLANQGSYLPPQSIRRIVDSVGNVICDIESVTPCRLASGAAAQNPVADAVDVFLISDILSDNQARTPVFGPSSSLVLDRPAAAKTGTTNDFRDAWTIGYTPQLVTGVWVGNASNVPMDSIAGARAAAPIWNQFMREALAGEPILSFAPPTGAIQIEICRETGTVPSDACPERQMEWFTEENPPKPAQDDLWQRVAIDRTTGQLAAAFTPANLIEEEVFLVYPPAYRAWAERKGIRQPPTDTSPLFSTPPQVEITRPGNGEVVAGTVSVVGVADVAGFSSYALQYGVSHSPGAFSEPVWGPFAQPVQGGLLGQWSTEDLSDGPYTLRLQVFDSYGNEYESRVTLTVDNPDPTPLPEPTPTWTPTWTPEPLATSTSSTGGDLPTPTPDPFDPTPTGESAANQ